MASRPPAIVPVPGGPLPAHGDLEAGMPAGFSPIPEVPEPREACGLD